jgi:hypothetical protein
VETSCHPYLDGALVTMTGGAVSLFDRRLRVGVPSQRKHSIRDGGRGARRDSAAEFRENKIVHAESVETFDTDKPVL